MSSLSFIKRFTSKTQQTSKFSTKVTIFQVN
jgi:hypothetical protein